MKDIQCTVIIPAAGKGKRMNDNRCKQYIELEGKPILAYTIDVFEKCDEIQNIILVVGKGEVDYCRKKIVEKYNYGKIISIVEGGKERQDSVYEGIKKVPESSHMVLIHDGARPLIGTDQIKGTIDNGIKYGACVLGVKVKDTIKVVDDNNNIVDTPSRNKLWAIQTPQTFKKELITLAYEKAQNDNYVATDDSMLVEKYLDIKVKIVEGLYSNIKITTIEDLTIAKNFIS
ncbi:2-C-methyl-D-erythritol 4-phosphate cytidylyltransferase [Vallitalea sediminicola]